MAAYHQGLSGLDSNTDVLRRVIDRLAESFSGVFAAEVVEDRVLDSYRALEAGASVRAHLVSNTERFARERLVAVAQADGLVLREVPEILFVCVQNSGRSQIAAALMDHHAQGRVHVRSAGSVPAAGMEIAVVEALYRLGVSVDGAYPKPLTEEVVVAADVVVTMGCGDLCPLLPGRRYVDWSTADPAGRSVDEILTIAGAIDRQVLHLLDDIARSPRMRR